MQLVVPIAVKKAVSAATRTFTANSMIRCFFIRFFVFFSVVRGCPFVFSVVRGCPFVFRWCGGAPSFFRWCGGAGVSLSRGWRREITQEADCLRLE